MDNFDLEDLENEWDEESWDIDNDPEKLLWLVTIICWICRAQVGAVAPIVAIPELSQVATSTCKVGNPSKDLISIRMKSQMDQLNKFFIDDKQSISTIRMNKKTFVILCELLRGVGLTDSRYIKLGEMVAIFLNICGHCLKNRYQSTDWTRSGQTISKIFHRVLSAILKLHHFTSVVPEPIQTNCEEIPWKYFEGCLGALDGTHIKVMVPEDKKGRYRNRKGEITTNVLAVVDKFGRFIYVYPGWEGSAADSRVLRDAVTKPNGFKVPVGNYYLVDSGYTNGPGFLSPFRGHRYHLGTFGKGHPPPSCPEEYFNWRHSQARCIVERAFGNLKNRWKILGYGSYYSTTVVNNIIIACCILKNFIYKETGTVDDISSDEYLESEDGDDCVENIPMIEHTEEWSSWRLQKAHSMWNEWTCRHT